MSATSPGPFVQFTASYPPRVCGVGDYTAHLARAMQETAPSQIAQNSITVWMQGGESMDWSYSVSPEFLHPTPLYNGKAFPQDKEFLALLRRTRPALVHLQWERSLFRVPEAICFRLPRLLRKAGVPLVTTFHALDGPKHWKRAHRAALLPLLYGSESVVVCSERQRTVLQKLPGLASRVRLIPVGSVVPVGIRTEPVGRTPLRLVYFGFVWRGRNIEVLLQTLQAVQKTPNGTGAVLDIVGEIRDDEYKRELDAVAERLGVADAVCWRGSLKSEQVGACLANADIALLPFATGASTGRTTLMAALAQGLPTVTMATSENLSPLFADGQNLCFTPVNDAQAFAERTVALVQNPALQVQLAQGARQLSQHFAWPEIARQTWDLPAYRRALG